jgi:hypothetical protein
VDNSLSEEDYKNMRYNEIVTILAPCGLNCGKCMAYNDGEIRKHSAKLKELLGSFDNYAKRFTKFWPVFENYSQFNSMLEYFAQGSCRGCRSGDCKYPNCGVAECHKKKKTDFCFQCGEFPCDKSNLDENLKARWVKMNMRMKEIGVKKYYVETKNIPRYI